MPLRQVNLMATFFLIALGVYVLLLGKNLLVPLAVALVFWYIIVRVIHFYQHLPKISWKMPNSLAMGLAVITAGVVIYLFFLALSHSIIRISHDTALYQKKWQSILAWVNSTTHGQFDIGQMISQIDLKSFFSKFFVILSSVASNFILILVYLIFLLLEYRSFDSKLESMCKTPDQFTKVKAMIEKIDADIASYLKIKTAINAIAGLLSYLLLLAFGIKHAEFWGILVFLLHYIPFIGPLAAVLFILLAISIQITTILPFIGLAILLVLIQVGTGNFLEPKWMGTRLNLSPLAILLSLAFWGYLWGVVGMFLCIPIMVILTIILAKFKNTRPIAIILSDSGKVGLDKE